MAILGLTNTNNLSAFMALTNRRRVFYTYPNGAAPLVGLLSIMEDEVTDAPTFGWWEQRFLERGTTLNATLQFYTASSATDLASVTTAGAAVTWTANAFIQTRTVADGARYLRPGDVVTYFNMKMTAGTADLKVLITAVDYTNMDRFTGRILVTAASTIVNNATPADNVGKSVRVTGSAHEEGGVAYTNLSRYPTNPVNYTQIFRTPFSFTRTALKEPLQWDKTGAYKHVAKDKGLDHMVQIENAFLFGTRTSYLAANADGESVHTRTTGGVEWFLQQWELGNITNTGAFDYRPGGTVATLNSDSNKRIIDASGTSNTITRTELEGYLQRVFSVSNNKTNEKLVLGGAGFIGAINVTYERLIQTTRSLGKKDDETYGMNLTGLQTVHGMIWMKSHPLFSQRSDMMYNALVLDVGNLKYRYLTDSDTILLKNRQNPGEDRRRDEWLTECGLECRFPESHLYFKNVQTISG
jgi:hypothetical protein